MEKILFNEENKERLDKFLVKNLPEFSRSEIQKLIKQNKVKVNGQPTSVHHFLKNGNVIEFEISKKPQKEIKTEIKILPEIIAETDDYLVINKPAGLVVHPTETTLTNTLVDWLLNKYPNLKQLGEDSARPGIVHRLDKDVSGLMVVAKTQPMFENLKLQFKNHEVKKVYLGLAQGEIETAEGKIDFPIKRSKLTGKMASLPKGEEGKNSITKFDVIARYINYTYLKLTIETGRTHQIRTHLQAYGHPLVGDKIYKNKKVKEKIELDRIFLHSHILGFNDLNNNWQEFKLPLPSKLQNILKTLK